MKSVRTVREKFSVMCVQSMDRAGELKPRVTPRMVCAGLPELHLLQAGELPSRQHSIYHTSVFVRRCYFHVPPFLQSGLELPQSVAS